MGHQEAHHEVHQHAAHDKVGAHPDQLQQVEHHATQAFQSCVNDARVVMAGGFNGMVKDAQKEWKEHPLQLVGEVALGAAVGGTVAIAAAAATPLEAAGLAMAGVAGLGAVAWDQLVNKAERNQKVMSALVDAAKPGQSEAQIQKDQKVIEDQLGKDIFHGVLIAGSGWAGGAGALAAREAESNGLKAAMDAFFRANPENNKSSADSMKKFLEGDHHAFDQGRLPFKPQPSLKFEPNTRPPETSQGLHHIVIEGHEGH